MLLRNTLFFFCSFKSMAVQKDLSISCSKDAFRKNEINKNKHDKFNGIIPLMAKGGVHEGFDRSGFEGTNFCKAQI